MLYVPQCSALFRFITFFFCLFFLTFPSYGNQSKGQEKIKAGYYFVPNIMEGADQNKIKRGYLYELLQHIAKYAGWEYEYVYGTFAELLEKCHRGEIDILPGVFLNAEIQRQFLSPDMSLGNASFYIAVKQQNTSINREPASLNGKTIGFSFSEQMDVFNEFIDRYNLKVTLKEFKTSQERNTALEENKIDAYLAVFPFSGDLKDKKAVLFIGQRDYSLAIAPNRPDILKKWNNAAASLFLEDPNFKKSLAANFFYKTTINTSLTSKEEQWIKTHDSITVGYMDSYWPYCGELKNGKPSGIMKTILSEILKKLNLSDLKINYVPFKNSFDLVSALQDGKIDLAAPFSGNLNTAEKYNFHITEPIITSSRYLIRKITTEITNKNTIAIDPTNIIQKEHALKQYPNCPFVECSSVSDCIKAVHNDLASFTSIDGLLAYPLLRDLDYSDLIVQQENLAETYCFAVNGNSDTLLRLLNRGINQLETKYADNEYLRYMDTHLTYSLKDIIRDNSVPFVIGFLVFLLLIGLLNFFAVKRSREKNRLREEYQEKLKSAFLAAQKANLDLKLLRESIRSSFPLIISFNVSEGTYKITENDIKELWDIKTEGTIDEFNSQVRIRIKNLHEQENFLSMFNRDSLINSYSSGKTRLVIRYIQTFQNNTAHWVEFVYMMTEEDGVILSTAFLRLIDHEVSSEEKQRGLESIVSSLTEKFTVLVHIDFETGKKDMIFFDSDYPIEWDKLSLPYKEMMYAYSEHFVFPEDKKIFLHEIDEKNVAKAVSNGKCHVVRYRTLLNNQIRWVECRFVRHKEHAGKNCVFMGFRNITDEVTEEIKRTQELNTAHLKVENANMAKTKFLFNMSHDIRTPMNAIIGFNNMAMRDINNREKALSYLEKANISGKMLLNLINDVLDMSRIESGNFTLSAQKKNLNDIFKEISPILTELAAAKNINIEFSVDSLQNKWAYVDISHTDRILINIISNAIKYTPSGGNIDVRLSQLDEKKDSVPLYAFTVQDNGIGMSEEFQKKMFDEFTREENSTVSGIQGTGLGLPLAKKITEIIGGSISCQSKKGIGTTFTIVLPFKTCEDAGEQETDKNSPAQKSFVLEGKKILLVEDNLLNQEIAVDILEQAKIIVTVSSNGKEAVNTVQKFGPDYFDAVLMDIQMPIMDGYEACKAIRSMYPHSKLPIIALSANAFDEDKKKSIKAGMDDHISKPIDMKTLFTALSTFLSKHKDTCKEVTI